MYSFHSKFTNQLLLKMKTFLFILLSYLCLLIYSSHSIAIPSRSTNPLDCSFTSRSCGWEISSWRWIRPSMNSINIPTIDPKDPNSYALKVDFTGLSTRARVYYITSPQLTKTISPTSPTGQCFTFDYYLVNGPTTLTTPSKNNANVQNSATVLSLTLMAQVSSFRTQTTVIWSSAAGLTARWIKAEVRVSQKLTFRLKFNTTGKRGFVALKNFAFRICSASTVAPRVTQTLVPRITQSVTVNVTPMVTRKVISIVTPSVTVRATAAPTMAPTVTPKVTSIVTQRITLITTPTSSPRATLTVAPTVVPTVISKVTPTVTTKFAPVVTQRITPPVSLTVTPTVTPTVNPIVTQRITLTTTPTPSPRVSSTVVQTITSRVTTTVTSTITPTVTAIPTVTQRITPTVTPAFSPTTTPTTPPPVTTPIQTASTPKLIVIDFPDITSQSTASPSSSLMPTNLFQIVSTASTPTLSPPPVSPFHRIPITAHRNNHQSSNTPKTIAAIMTPLLVVSIAIGAFGYWKHQQRLQRANSKSNVMISMSNIQHRD